MNSQRIVCRVLVCVAFVMSGCGAIFGSAVLNACGGFADDADRALGDVDGVRIEFEKQSHEPGEKALFTWLVAEDAPPLGSGDEWVIECWDGEMWKDGWMAIRIYDADPDVVYLDDEVSVTDDGFEVSDGVTGTVAIPDDAPDGLYRIREIVAFPDRGEVRSLLTIQGDGS